MPASTNLRDTLYLSLCFGALDLGVKRIRRDKKQQELFRMKNRHAIATIKNGFIIAIFVIQNSYK